MLQTSTSLLKVFIKHSNRNTASQKIWSNPTCQHVFRFYLTRLAPVIVLYFHPVLSLSNLKILKILMSMSSVFNDKNRCATRHHFHIAEWDLIDLIETFNILKQRRLQPVFISFASVICWGFSSHCGTSTASVRKSVFMFIIQEMRGNFKMDISRISLISLPVIYSSCIRSSSSTFQEKVGLWWLLPHYANMSGIEACSWGRISEGAH